LQSCVEILNGFAAVTTSTVRVTFGSMIMASARVAMNPLNPPCTGGMMRAA
jgi:hypothetical protein